MVVPMARYVNATRDPCSFATRDMIDESLERQGATRPAGEATVQSDRHHLGHSSSAFLVKNIEGVAQICEELITGVEALRRGETHVIGIQCVGHDEVRV